ncbi:MAG: tRNA uridine-5-carboxymethylaminomethyl(34) synthesis GTPase MnmE [Spirochaetaceae bacterium]|nr:tRNA uridine-5-carboxymethylaminomethyl(34) synthesis GTPase MnmE [Spirochaetaceae bacterium]
MPRSYLDLPVPIAAAATAPGEAALALVRASGPGALELAASCFSRPAALLAAPGHSLVHGRLVHPATGEAADEVLASVFRAPRSFTGEDAVEFSCHGSPAALRRVLEALEAAGFSPALPGEFAFRAFANGKSDLVRAEAIDELIRSRSEGAREGALLRLEGGLSRRLEAARAALLDVLAEVEIRLDYAEEDGAPAEAPNPGAIAALRDSLAALAATYRAGRLYRDGVRVALAGRANAGKSSLFNLLLREERSIVSPEAGTTRDWIEAGLELAGFPVRLLDTAGLREASGAVEAEGVARSRRLLAEAELVVYVVDGAAGLLTAEDEAFLADRPEAIRAWNKIDAAGAAAAPAGFVALSAATGEGFPALLAALEASLRALARGEAKGASAPGRGAPGGGAPGCEAQEGGVSGPAGVPARGAPAEAELRVASERQKVLLDRAVAALDAALAKGGAPFDSRLDAFALDLREAADALGEITGEISAPEILEAIFSRFCLGK